MSAQNLAVRLQFEPQKTLGYASIGASYVAIGSGLLNASRVIYIQNLTNGQLQFSLDGVNDHFPLASMAALSMDEKMNGGNIAQGTVVWVKGSVSSGSVYVSSAYGAGVTI